MLEGTYHLNICLGPQIPGFPEIKRTSENPPKEEIQATHAEVCKIPHSVTFFQEDGIMKAVYTTPRGKQKVDKVTYNEYCAAWEVYAGSEGVELFHCVMIMSESTDAVWGFTCGVSPLFRGYSPFEGNKVT